MPMDIDYVAAKQAIDELMYLLNQQPHGEREGIADEIIEFVEVMKERWSINQ